MEQEKPDTDAQTHTKVELSPCNVWVLKYREAKLWTTEKLGVIRVAFQWLTVGHRDLVWPNITCSHFVADCRMLPQHISVLFTLVQFLICFSPSCLQQSIELQWLVLTKVSATASASPLLFNELQNGVRPQHSERQQGTQFCISPLEWWKKNDLCQTAVLHWLFSN